MSDTEAGKAKSDDGWGWEDEDISVPELIEENNGADLSGIQDNVTSLENWPSLDEQEHSADTGSSQGRDKNLSSTEDKSNEPGASCDVNAFQSSFNPSQLSFTEEVSKSDLLSSGDRGQHDLHGISDDNKSYSSTGTLGINTCQAIVQSSLRGLETDASNLGGQNSELVLELAESSPSDDGSTKPAEIQTSTVHHQVMTTSISTGSDGSEEERFVKVKPGDFEFESTSKSSSQSGKENFEYDDQLLTLSSQCDTLRSSLAEKERDYLKVKLELESILLERNVEYDALTKSSQQITKLKEDVYTKDEELMELRTLVEESTEILEKFKIQLTDEETLEYSLPQIVRSLISAVQQQGHILPSEVVRTETGTGNESRAQHEMAAEDDSKPNSREVFLETEVDRLNQLLEERNLQIQTLSAENSVLEQQQVSLESVNDKPAKDDASERVNLVSENNQEMLSNVDKVNEILQEKVDLIASLEATLQSTQAELAEMKKVNVEGQQTVGASADTYSTIELDSDEQQDLISGDDGIQLRSLIIDKPTTINIQNLMKRNEETEVRLAELQKELDEAAEREGDVVGGYQIATASLEKAQLELAEVQKEIESKDEEISSLQDLVSQANREVGRLKEALIAKDEELVELQTYLEEISTNLKEKELTLIAKVTSLEKENKKLLDNINSITIAASNKDDTSQADEEVKAAITSKNEEICLLTQKLDSSLEQNTRYNAQIGEITRKYEKLEAKFKKALAKIKQQNTQLTDLKESERSTPPSPEAIQHQLAHEDRDLSISNPISELQGALKAEIQEPKELSQIDQLQNELEQRKQELLAALEKIDQFSHEFTKKDKQLEAAEGEVKHLSQMMSELIEKVKKLDEVRAEINQLPELKSKLFQKDQELLAAQEHITQLSGLEALLVERSHELDSAGEEMSQLRFELVQKEKELQEARDELNRNVGSLTDKNTDLEQLMKHVDELQQFISTQNEELSIAISAKDEEIRKTMQLYEDYYQQSQEQISQTTYNLQAKADEIFSLKEEFTELEKDLASSQKQSTDLKRLLQSSEHSLHQTSIDLQEANSMLDERKLELQLCRNEQDLLQEKVSNLFVELKKKTAAVSELDEALSIRTEQINLLEFNLNECKAILSENNQIISQLERKVSDQNDELEASQRREEEAMMYKESYNELLQLKRENKSLELRLADADNRFQQIIDEYDRKSQEIELLKDAEVLGTRNEVQQIKDERDKYEKELLQIRETLSAFESEKSKFLTKVHLAESALSDGANRISLLESELNVKVSVISTLETEAKRMKELITDLEATSGERQVQIEEMSILINQLQLQTKQQVHQMEASSSSIAPTPLSEDATKLLEQLKSEKNSLERKVELLQTKIYEIEVSEMKSFEECLMLKSWMREVELENIKYAEELRGFQASVSDGENPKLKTLQDEILRLIQCLEDRDKRSAQLTMEITRLLEERDGLQLKLSSVLKQHVLLNERIGGTQPSSESTETPFFDKDQLKKKLAELEDINYSINVDLKRERETRRLVQEQLLFSQTSKFYRNQSKSGNYHVTPTAMNPVNISTESVPAQDTSSTTSTTSVTSSVSAGS